MPRSGPGFHSKLSMATFRRFEDTTLIELSKGYQCIPEFVSKVDKEWLLEG